MDGVELIKNHYMESKVAQWSGVMLIGVDVILTRRRMKN